MLPKLLYLKLLLLGKAPWETPFLSCVWRGVCYLGLLLQIPPKALLWLMLLYILFGSPAFTNLNLLPLDPASNFESFPFYFNNFLYQAVWAFLLPPTLVQASDGSKYILPNMGSTADHLNSSPTLWRQPVSKKKEVQNCNWAQQVSSTHFNYFTDFSHLQSCKKH